MSCPGIDQLLDLRNGETPDPDLEAHLERCPSCQADLRILLRIPTAPATEVEVPERLIQRVLAELPAPDCPPESQRLPRAQLLVTGFLGSLTAMAAVVAAGPNHGGNPLASITFFLGVGAASVVLQLRAGSRARPAAG